MKKFKKNSENYYLNNTYYLCRTNIYKSTKNIKSIFKKLWGFNITNRKTKGI